MRSSASAPPAVLVAALEQLGDEQTGVVVAALRAPVEFAGAIEQSGDAGHAVGAVERELERLDRIPTEFVTERQVHDALAIALRIQALDRAEVVESRHRPHFRGPSSPVYRAPWQIRRPGSVSV